MRLALNHPWTRLALIVVILILMALGYWPQPAIFGKNQAVITPAALETPAGLYHVTDVVDGDTIKIDKDGAKETVRFIGIDTPETVHPTKPVQCFGREASARTKELLLDKDVRIETDPSQGARDKYGRMLAYIFLPDGTNVGLKLIEDGYAYEYTYDAPYKYQTEFKAAQLTAKVTKAGLWADGACGARSVS